jgi:hypothetical protein
MHKNTGTRRALIAGLILAVVGGTGIIAPAHADDRDRRKDAGSGMTRMQNMGRPKAASSAPAPQARPAAPQAQPAPRPAPTPAPAARPAPSPAAARPAPQPSPPPRVTAPQQPRIMPQPAQRPPVSRTGQGNVPTLLPSRQPERREAAPPPRSEPPRVQPAPQPSVPQAQPQAPRQQIMPQQPQARPSRQGTGMAPIMQLRPRDEAQTSPRPEQPSAPPAASEPPRSRIMPGPQPPSSRGGSSRVGTGGAPITRIRPAEREQRPEPRSEQRAPAEPERRGNVARIRTAPAPGTPILRLRSKDTPHLPDPQREAQPRERDRRDRWHGDRDGRPERWQGNRNWRPDRDQRHPWHDRGWNHPDWNRPRHDRDRGHTHFDRHHHSRDHWWISFALAPSLYYSTWTPFYGFGTSLYYTPSYWGTTYYTYSDPLCFTTRSVYYHRPLTYTLTYPIYTTPYFSSTTTYIYDSGSYSQGYADGLLQGLTQGQLLDYKPLPSERGYVAPYEPAPAMEEPIVVYGASGPNGELRWSDTAASIVNDVLYSTDRARAAQRYLGRSIQGAWEVTLESKQDVGRGVELVCRAITPAANGEPPTIIVNVPRAVGDLEPGRRLSVTGRLMELSVNDPQFAGGLLVLDEGDVSW